MKFKFLCLLLVSTVPLWAKSFPLCMYGVDKPEYLPHLKQAGFTCLQSYERNPKHLAPLARAAKKHQLRVLFHPDQLIGSAYENEAASWPVLAWYLVDEPDVARWSRARVLDKQRQTRQAFAHHETALVIGQGKTATPFYDLPDNLMVDWYPVPHLPLTSFGDNVRLAKDGQRAYGAGERPLWGVVQSFDWREYKQHRPDNDRIGRFPTQAEIRFMSYDAILNGADGLFYFIFTTNGQPLPSAAPQHWARVRAVTREIARLRAVLENGTIIPNAVCVTAPLALQTRRYKKYDYVILLNRSDQAVPVPAELQHKSYRLLFKQPKTDRIPPYGVWVLRRKI